MKFFNENKTLFVHHQPSFRHVLYKFYAYSVIGLFSVVYVHILLFSFKGAATMYAKWISTDCSIREYFEELLLSLQLCFYCITHALIYTSE